MKLIDRVIDFFLGIKLVEVKKAKASFDLAINECDIDKDGYLNARELIAVFKELIK